MPSDEEFRRVAEDLRGLARSLGRDLREAADQIRDQSRTVGRGWRAGMPGPPPPGAPGGPGDPAGDPNGQPGVGPDGQPTSDPAANGQPSWRGGPGWWSWSNGAGQTWSSDQFGWHGRHRHRHHWGPPGGWGPPAPGTATATAPPPPPAQRPRRSRPPIRHKRDGSTLIGGLALVFGLAWLAARTHLASVSAEVVLAVALLVVGGTMVVTARTDWALSRKMWPALVGAVLVVAAIGTSPSLGVPTSWHDFRVGQHTFTYTTWDSISAPVRGGVGQTHVDLATLPTTSPPAPASATLDIRAIAGEVVVDVPADLHVVLDAELTAGEIRVDGVPIDQGFRPHAKTDIGNLRAATTLTLHVRSGAGSLQIDTVKPKNGGPA